MISTQHTQSLTDFRQNAAETLERINRTGNAEIITVNGEARAVLMSPEEYDRLAGYTLSEADVADIKQGLADIEAGRVSDAESAFGRIRAELTKLKQEQRK